MTTQIPVELHRPFDIVSLPDGGRGIEITASQTERDAIARRLGLLGLGDFTVRGRLDPLRRGRSAVFDARMTASVTQECIVSGDPVEAAIDEEIHVRLMTEDEAEARAELDLDVDEEDVEVAAAGIVDLGDICVQYLTVALDPYPRAPGAVAPAMPEEDDADDNIVPNPFAVLKKLKDKT
jgi:uncharacterized metal-binding protein YceD (DUF177 family)